MMYIADALRASVIKRAQGRCEYCLLRSDDSPISHEVDHVIPEKHRGTTDLKNLCYACIECNRHKGSDFASFDPETGAITRLFNPRKDVWSEYFRLDGVQVVPLSPEGRVTVFVLKLNDAIRVQIRHVFLQAGRYPRE